MDHLISKLDMHMKAEAAPTGNEPEKRDRKREPGGRAKMRRSLNAIKDSVEATDSIPTRIFDKDDTSDETLMKVKPEVYAITTWFLGEAYPHMKALAAQASEKEIILEYGGGLDEYNSDLHKDTEVRVLPNREISFDKLKLSLKLDPERMRLHLFNAIRGIINASLDTLLPDDVSRQVTHGEISEEDVQDMGTRYEQAAMRLSNLLEDYPFRSPGRRFDEIKVFAFQGTRAAGTVIGSATVAAPFLAKEYADNTNVSTVAKVREALFPVVVALTNLNITILGKLREKFNFNHPSGWKECVELNVYDDGTMRASLKPQVRDEIARLTSEIEPSDPDKETVGCPAMHVRTDEGSLTRFIFDYCESITKETMDKVVDYEKFVEKGLGDQH